MKAKTMIIFDMHKVKKLCYILLHYIYDCILLFLSSTVKIVSIARHLSTLQLPTAPGKSNTGSAQGPFCCKKHIFKLLFHC